MVLPIVGILALTIVLVAVVVLYVKWICQASILEWFVFDGCWWKVIGSILQGICYCVMVVINIATGSND